MILGEVCLYTQDVCRLAQFYRVILNLSGNDQNPVHQFILTEGTALTICHADFVSLPERPKFALAFTVENVDEEYERLLALGIPILQPPTTQPWGARNLHFLDTDGNAVFMRSIPASF